MNEKICVLMTSYNPKNYILEQVESIMRQDGVDVEIVLRDDASTNKEFLDKLKGKERLTIIEGEKNLGVANNIKELFKYALENKSEYQYFAYSDQDDIWFPDKLNAAIKALKVLNLEKCCVYYSNLLVTDKELNPSHELFKRNVVKNTVGQSMTQVFLFACTSVFNIEMVKEVVKYDFSHLGFDSLLYYLGILNGEIVYDDNPHIYYRQHGDNVSGEKNQGFKYVIDKIKRMIINGKNDAVMKYNANFILQYMSNFLNDDDKMIVYKVANYTSLGSRISIIFDSKIQAGYFPKNIYCWCRLLLSKY